MVNWMALSRALAQRGARLARGKAKRLQWAGGGAVMLLLVLVLVSGWPLSFKAAHAQVVVNLKTDAHAVGDGMTDDSAAFGTAISMLSQGGGTLLIPPRDLSDSARHLRHSQQRLGRRDAGDPEGD